MTQEEMNSEREKKEAQGIKHVDVKTPGGATVRVFADGKAYALDAFGGRFVKFEVTGIWDYDSPGGTLQYSHADEKYAQENRILTEAWQSLQY